MFEQFIRVVTYHAIRWNPPQIQYIYLMFVLVPVLILCEETKGGDTLSPSTHQGGDATATGDNMLKLYCVLVDFVRLSETSTATHVCYAADLMVHPDIEYLTEAL